MNAAGTRGDALLLAHCASLDPAAARAPQRLADALGEELARRLVRALCSGPRPGTARSLGARPVFAA